MRHPLSTLALLCALIVPLTLGTPPALSAAAQPAAASTTTARVIVKFKADSPLLQQRRQTMAAAEAQAVHTLRAQSLGQRVGLALSSGAPVMDRAQVMLASGIDSATLAARLAKEADVEYAVVNERRHVLAVPNDPLYLTGSPINGPTVGQWYLRAPAGDAKSAIDAEKAWDISTGSPSVIVAILDTGIRFDHEDLAGKVPPGYDMVNDLLVANDGNARDADASDPGDWVTQAEHDADPTNCTVSSSGWHGTQTAGVVGAITNNGIGMASVGRQVRILPVRVLGKCGGDDADIAAGMLWAAGIPVSGVPDNPNPAQVLNLSLGGAGACTPLYADVVAQVIAKGAVIVASAGNSAGHAVHTPANCTGVIAVAGLRHLGTKVGFSDIGPEVAVSAPGGNCVTIGAGEPCQFPILTTSNSGTTFPNAGGSIYTDSFNASVGTSFSAPLVAGTAALMLSVKPSLTPANVRTLLQVSAREFPTTGGTAGIAQCRAPNSTDQDQCYCTTSTCGAGMLDAGAAVQVAATGLQAVIGASPSAPVANDVVTLSSATSLVGAGRSIVAYQWTLIDGGGIVSAFNSATNAATATVTPTAAGRFTVRLSVTDDQAHTSSDVFSLDVAAVPAPPPAPPPSSGGGGGAIGAEWLAGLALGIVALRRRRASRG